MSESALLSADLLKDLELPASASGAHLLPRTFLSRDEDEARDHSVVGRLKPMTLQFRSSHKTTHGELSWFGGRLPIHVDSPVRMVMDGIGMVLVLSDTVIVPFMLAWERGSEESFLYLACIMVLFWSCDFISNFLTSFTKEDVLVRDFRAIAKQYAKTWLFVDLAVVSVDWLAIGLQSVSDPSGKGNTDANKYIKVIRCLKAFRLVRVLAVLRSGRFAQVQEAVVRRSTVLGVNLQIQFAMGLTKLVFVILWLNHLGSCFWWVFVKNYKDYSTTDNSWHDLIIADSDVPANVNNGELDAFWYVSGFYWSITAMFSCASVLPPQNYAETVFSIVYIIFGMLFGSSLISSVAAMLVDFQVVTRDQNEKLRTLRKYLRQNGVQPSLSLKIQKQIVERIFADTRLSHQDVPVLALLSTKLRANLWYEIYAPRLMSEPVLMMCDGVDDLLLGDMCSSDTVMMQSVGPGHIIFNPNTNLDRAFYIVGGKVHYTGGMALVSATIRTLPSQESQEALVELGRTQWLATSALWTHWKSQGLAESVGHGELMLVLAEGFAAVLKRHRSIAEIVQDYAKTLVKVIKDERPLLSDLSSMMKIDSDRLICGMPQGTRLKLSLPALRAVHAQATFNAKKLKAFRELEKEVHEGKCYLTSNGQGSVLRVVNLITLRLERWDGKFCVEVGKWSLKESIVLQTRAQLPGSKMRAGELAMQALRRLTGKELSVLNPQVGGDAAVEVEEAASDSYGVTTRYVKTHFTATTSAPAAKDICVLPVGAEGFEVFQDIELWETQGDFLHSDQSLVYAWVTEAEFKHLSHSGMKGGRFMFLKEI